MQKFPTCTLKWKVREQRHSVYVSSETTCKSVCHAMLYRLASYLLKNALHVWMDR